MRPLAIALCALLAGPALAETYRFDMGSADSPLADGCSRITPADLFAEGKPFGWHSTPSMVIFRGGPANPYYLQRETSAEYAMYSDGVLSIGENTFSFRVQPGRYAITCVIGDLALDEHRPGNSVWANEVLVASDVATNATVKTIRFPVQVDEGVVSLRFRADSAQRYATVIAVSAEPLDSGVDCPLEVTECPPEPVTPDLLRRNWASFQEGLVVDWQRAKTELHAEGEDIAYWQQACDALRALPDLREYIGLSLGAGEFERLAQRTGDLSLDALCTIAPQMGVDGFVTNSKAAIAELKAAGLKYGVGVSAEALPEADLAKVEMNLLVNADGSTQTLPGVWSNCGPQAIAVFQARWRELLKDIAPGAALFMIDEPRGMWYSGRYGDCSPAAQEAFSKWAQERGCPEAAADGIPPRGRTMAFYRFYQFRLDSVPRFVRAAMADTPAAEVPAMPGNGNAGPEQMNHSCYWPPAIARHGMIAATWAYDSPASCKMYAETLRTAEEFGGQSYIVPPLYSEAQTALEEIPKAAACTSALNTKVCPWHFAAPVTGPNRVDWMKTVYLGARLTHATSGLQHVPPLYVWCPESIVYNDLVEMSSEEAGNWRRTWQSLFDANADYAVTCALKIPAGAKLLWSCARPVLTEEEFAVLRGFVDAGGTLLCAFEADPELPDGSPLTGFADLPTERVRRIALTPEALAAAADGPERNLPVTDASVKTFIYRRDGKRVHLLNNNSLEQAAIVAAPCAMRDVLTGRKIGEGEQVNIRPGRHALWEEE